MKRMLIGVIFFSCFCIASRASAEVDFKEISSRAENGDLESQLKMAEGYWAGEGLPIDYRKAVYWCSKAAEQGEPKAFFWLGAANVVGLGVPVNFEKAVYWYKRAAESGMPSAQWRLGAMYDLGKGITQDYDNAIYWYNKAAKQENKEAVCHIGSLFFDGNGVPQSYDKAAYWYSKGIENSCFKDGMMFEVLNIGKMCFEGKGYKKDFQQSLYWYSVAAESGNAEAFIPIGNIYYAGSDEVPKDYEKAMYWYSNAACLGGGTFEEGRNLSVSILETIYNVEIEAPDQRPALFWCNKAAELGSSNAQYLIGSHYQNSISNIGYEKAFYWYEKAANHGHTGAQAGLGGLYNFGNGVQKDYQKANYWLRKAANKGSLWSQYYLGTNYIEGNGVPIDFVQGYAWCNLAASTGFIAAKKCRDHVNTLMTTEQIAEAQSLTSLYARQIKIESQPPVAHKNAEKIGTGFIITRNGYILTCNHVINKAGSVFVKINGENYSAKIVIVDKRNDIALIKIPGQFEPLAFSPVPIASVGQDVYTIGFPNPSMQGLNPKFTKGNISSLTGFHDDVRLYQVSVPVQPGNSGGPLIDMYGNVIGIIVAMLDAEVAFNVSGALPQNVNYAVKSHYIKALIESVPDAVGMQANPSKTSHKDSLPSSITNGVVMVIAHQQK